MLKNRFEFYERNGKIRLYVFDDDHSDDCNLPVYGFASIEFFGGGQALKWFSALHSDALGFARDFMGRDRRLFEIDDRADKDGNSDLRAAYVEDTYCGNLICDQAGLYVNNMGGSGKSLFGIQDWPYEPKTTW